MWQAQIVSDRICPRSTPNLRKRKIPIAREFRVYQLLPRRSRSLNASPGEDSPRRARTKGGFLVGKIIADSSSRRFAIFRESGSRPRQRRRTLSRGRPCPWSWGWPYRSCGCSCSCRRGAGGRGRCYRWGSRRRWRNCRSSRRRSTWRWCGCGYLPTGEYPHIVNILFVSSDSLRVFVKGGGIRDVAAGVI
jgi:hypothetical protein